MHSSARTTSDVGIVMPCDWADLEVDDHTVLVHLIDGYFAGLGSLRTFNYLELLGCRTDQKLLNSDTLLPKPAWVTVRSDRVTSRIMASKH
jgi:hypothetical protein